MNTRPDTPLDQWLRVSNVRSLVLTALMTLVALSPGAGVVGDPARVHDLLLSVALPYLVLHGGLLLHIRRLSAAGDAASVRTAEYLRDPRRITSLDLAAYWAGLASLGPLLGIRG
jgi:hypothetical protein